MRGEGRPGVSAQNGQQREETVGPALMLAFSWTVFERSNLMNVAIRSVKH